MRLTEDSCYGNKLTILRVFALLKLKINTRQKTEIQDKCKYFGRTYVYLLPKFTIESNEWLYPMLVAIFFKLW